METVAEKVGEVRVLALRGRLDTVSTPEFESQLIKLIGAGETKIVLDCEELKYVSSSGLGAFIAGGKAMGSSGKLVFAGLSKQLRSLFDMTGIATLFDIRASREDALQSLQ